MENILFALFGGVLIGLASSLLLLINGRTFGISGICASAIFERGPDKGWRMSAILGLIVGGLLMIVLRPDFFPVYHKEISLTLTAAGLLVGFGTQLGSGCTSGHGVCGISKFSARSIIATASFMASGILTVYILKLIKG